MLIASISIICIIVGYIILNYGNKFTYVVAMYFFSIAFMMVVAVLYISKVSSYHFPLKIDYDLYLALYNVKLHIRHIARLYNICVALFMLSSVVFLHLIRRFKWWEIFLFILPVIYFLIWNDSTTSKNLFLLVNTISTENAKLLSRIIYISTIINELIIVVYILIPFLTMAVYYKRTKIFTKRKYAVVVSVCILMIDAFVYFVFICGPFQNIMFNKVNEAKLPINTSNNQGYILAPVMLMFVLLCIMAIILFFKPFNSFAIIRKREIVHNAKMLNQNINMVLHVYKNAFIGIGQKFELTKRNITAGNDEKAIANVQAGLEIVDSHMAMLNKTLSLLRDLQIKYVPVNLIECIEKAKEKVAWPQNINIICDYKAEDIRIYGDQNQLTEVFANMLINSIEAIEKKNGTDKYVKISIITELELCVVEISDNGCGIEKKEIKNIFKPFYSTKPRITGGGVGLNYVENVVRQHHGDIVVRSEQGVYTIFQIILPIYKNKNQKKAGGWFHGDD